MGEEEEHGCEEKLGEGWRRERATAGERKRDRGRGGEGDSVSDLDEDTAGHMCRRCVYVFCVCILKGDIV